MKKLILWIAVLTVLFVCLSGIAFAANMSVDNLYDVNNRGKYKVNGEDGVWFLTVGFSYGMEITSPSKDLSYKSSKKKVASVSSDGIITCNKRGNTFITVTDNSTGDSVKIRLYTYDNEKHYEKIWMKPDKDSDKVVYTTLKKIYVKNSTLWVDLWVMNWTDAAIGKMKTTTDLYVANQFGDSDYEYELEDYRKIPNVSVTVPKIGKKKIGVVKINAGTVDATKDYYGYADAFCKGGIFAGDIYLYEE